MHPRRDGGQASVELALALPLLALLGLLLLQVGGLVLNQLAVTQAAREAARAAAVDAQPSAAVAAARNATRLDARRLNVTIGARPDAQGMVSVVVSYRSVIVMPFTDQVLLRPEVHGSATMRVEAPG